MCISYILWASLNKVSSLDWGWMKGKKVGTGLKRMAKMSHYSYWDYVSSLLSPSIIEDENCEVIGGRAEVEDLGDTSKVQIGRPFIGSNLTRITTSKIAQSWRIESEVISKSVSKARIAYGSGVCKGHGLLLCWSIFLRNLGLCEPDCPHAQVACRWASDESEFMVGPESMSLK